MGRPVTAFQGQSIDQSIDPDTSRARHAPRTDPKHDPTHARTLGRVPLRSYARKSWLAGSTGAPGGTEQPCWCVWGNEGGEGGAGLSPRSNGWGLSCVREGLNRKQPIGGTAWLPPDDSAPSSPSKDDRQHGTAEPRRGPAAYASLGRSGDGPPQHPSRNARPIAPGRGVGKINQGFGTDRSWRVCACCMRCMRMGCCII